MKLPHRHRLLPQRSLRRRSRASCRASQATRSVPSSAVSTVARHTGDARREAGRQLRLVRRARREARSPAGRGRERRQRRLGLGRPGLGEQHHEGALDRGARRHRGPRRRPRAAPRRRRGRRSRARSGTRRPAPAPPARSRAATPPAPPRGGWTARAPSSRRPRRSSTSASGTGRPAAARPRPARAASSAPSPTARPARRPASRTRIPARRARSPPARAAAACARAAGPRRPRVSRAWRCGGSSRRCRRTCPAAGPSTRGSLTPCSSHALRYEASRLRTRSSTTSVREGSR